MVRSLFFSLFTIASFSLQAKIYEVNGQHSFVNFELDYMQVSKVKGAFEKFQGTFDWDPETEKLTGAIFEIDVDSVNTRDKKRDNHLKRNDFFYVSKFPKISFVATDIFYRAKKPIKMKGKLSLRGVEREHVFNMTWKGEYPDPVDKRKKSLFLFAKTTINRKDFNVSWNKALDQGGWVVGDKVNVEIIIEANPTDARPAFSRFYRKTKRLLPGVLKAPTKSSFAPKANQQKKKPSP